MNFKSLQSFLIAHRQLLFLIAGILLFFITHTAPASAAYYASGTGAAAPANEDWGVFGWMMKSLANLIFMVAVGLGGMVASIGGLILDIAVNKTILEAGTFLKSTGADSFGGGIVALWHVIRDVFNILFIFSLVFLGIKTILKSDDSETQRKIGFIIIAALMINFSLYITQAVVDFTNIIAVQVFNQIMSGNATIAEYQDNLVKIGADSISGAFMNVAGITSFFGGSSFLDDIPSPLKVIIFGIMFMVFLIVAGVVFAMGAFLLIARFVTLIIYMVLSPIMFAGWIFPNFAQYQEKWWRGFLKQAFFAPAFLFMLYLSMVVLQRALKLMVPGGGNPDYSAAMKGDAMGINEFTIFFFFAMMIGFLYASIKVGEMMSISGAKTAMSLTQKTIGGATAGLVARAGRASIGGLGNKLSENESLKNWASRSAIGKGVLQGTRYVGDANFDARSTGLGGKFMGEAKKGGYKTRLDEVKKKEEEFSKSLGEIKDDDSRVNYLLQEKEALDHDLHHLKDEKADYRDTKSEKKLVELKTIRESMDQTHKDSQETNKQEASDLADLRKTELETNSTERSRIEAEAKAAESKATTDEERTRIAEKTALALAENTKQRTSIEEGHKMAIIQNRAEKENLQKTYDAAIKEHNLSVLTLENAKKKNEADERKKFEKKISDKEKEIKNQDEIIKQEKNRRQTGAYVNAKEYAGTKDRYAEAERIKKAAEEAFRAHGASEYTKQTQAKIINEQNTIIKGLKRRAKKENNALGYVGTLEGDDGVRGFVTGWAGSAITGRTRNQNRNAGKEVRKDYEKTQKGIKDDAHGAAHGAADSHATPAAHPPAGGGDSHAHDAHDAHGH